MKITPEQIQTRFKHQGTDGPPITLLITAKELAALLNLHARQVLMEAASELSSLCVNGDVSEVCEDAVDVCAEVVRRMAEEV